MQIINIHNPKIIDIVVEYLKLGKVVVLPFDTVYGLSCDFENKKALKKLFEIKNRPSKKQISIAVSDINMAKIYANINKEKEQILSKYFPGKYTVVFPKKYARNNSGIAIRIPSSEFIIQMCKIFNKAIVSTSANISGNSPINQIKEIFNWKILPDLAVDSGKIFGVSSQLIDFRSETPITLDRE